MNRQHFIIPPDRKISLKNYKADFIGSIRSKKDGQQKLANYISRLAKLQDILYAQHTYAMLIILQGMDASGKDSAIKGIMSGVNPQGVEVHSFKEPSAEELDHDYLWRTLKALPGRGRIGIFNRSYYEEVLVCRVRPEIITKQHLPDLYTGNDIWKWRYEDINNIERYLVRNGTVILKFFFNISREEQRQRILGRIDDPDKNWKFSEEDIAGRQYWHKYMKAYQEMLQHTSSKWAPWYIVPADHKWFARLVIADIIVSTLESLPLRYPQLNKDQERNLLIYKRLLEKAT